MESFVHLRKGNTPTRLQQPVPRRRVPRWRDPTVYPTERTPGQCCLGDPQVVNMSPVGLARFCTLRGWLSQWRYDDANGDAVKANHYYSAPDQRDKLRQAVGVCTDWLHRHGFSSEGKSAATGDSAL